MGQDFGWVQIAGQSDPNLSFFHVCAQPKSHGIWSFPVWIWANSMCGQNQTEVGFFLMQTQSGQSNQNSCNSVVTLERPSSQLCVKCILFVWMEIQAAATLSSPGCSQWFSDSSTCWPYFRTKRKKKRRKFRSHCPFYPLRPTFVKLQFSSKYLACSIFHLF